jgi:hypothetical protein
MPHCIEIRTLLPIRIRFSHIGYRIGVVVLALSLLGFVGETPNGPNGFDLSQHSVPLEDILSGGPPRDGIPAIKHPHFVSVDDATFLQENDRILGIQGKERAKAYPVKIMNWHEIVNDSLEGSPIVITYCPLCGTGIGFTRSLRGDIATFGVSGLLYQSDLLMYDHQTESLWSQIEMECVTGPLTGEKLDPLFLEHTSWGEWKKTHPQTLVLSTQTGYTRAYDRDPYVGYAQRGDLMFPISHIDPRYHTKEWVLGVEVQGVFKAYPFSELAKGPEIIRDTVNGQLILIQHNRAAHSAKVLAGDGTPIPSLMAYWFAWSAFHPDTLVFTIE